MKKNIVKVLGLSLAAIMAAGSLAGCGSDSGKEEGKDGKKSVTLTFGSHQSGSYYRSGTGLSKRI